MTCTSCERQPGVVKLVEVAAPGGDRSHPRARVLSRRHLCTACWDKWLDQQQKAYDAYWKRQSA
jgi:hypothetical protein